MQSQSMRWRKQGFGTHLAGHGCFHVEFNSWQCDLALTRAVGSFVSAHTANHLALSSLSGVFLAINQLRATRGGNRAILFKFDTCVRLSFWMLLYLQLLAIAIVSHAVAKVEAARIRNSRLRRGQP